MYKLKITTGKEIEYPSELLRKYKNGEFDENDLKGIFGKYVIHYYYYHQYADGICGISRDRQLFLKDCRDHMEFFSNRNEASGFRKTHFKDYLKRGNGCENIGYKICKSKVIKITKDNIDNIFDGKCEYGITPDFAILPSIE